MKDGFATAWNPQFFLNNADLITQHQASIISSVMINLHMIPMAIIQGFKLVESTTINLAIYFIKISPWMPKLGPILHRGLLTALQLTKVIRNDYKL